MTHEERVERLEEALKRVGDTAAGLRLVSERLEHIEDLLDDHLIPASLSTVTLKAAQPQVTSDSKDGSRSVGVLNPTPITIYVGIGGAQARAGADAISVPPTSVLVLPVYAEDFVVGAADADLAAGDAVVHLFRFQAVQPLFLGSI